MQIQKQQNRIKKAGWLVILILAANSVIAQSSVNSNVHPAEKLFVQLKVTPKTQSFMANVSEDSTMKFRVWFANPEKAKVTVSIQSETGNYSFSKNISDAWYAQTFDFTGVEDGIYTIEIAKGKERFGKKILIATDSYTMRTTKVY